MSDKTAYQRFKRYRERQARGAVYATCDIPNSLAVALIECGFLSEQDSFDAKKRGQALIAYAQTQRKKQTP